MSDLALHPRVTDGAAVASLAKGLAVLDLFTPSHSVITTTEIAAHLDLHKSSASRIAATLVSTGFLRSMAPLPGFRLGPKLAALGTMAVAASDLALNATPPLADLVEELGETGYIGVLDGQEAVTVAVVEGWHTVRMHSSVGRRNPAHRTALGRVILAGLEDDALNTLYPADSEKIRHDLASIRRRGWAFDDEDLEPGLRCIAAPIFDYTGRVIGGVSVAGPTTRIKQSTAPELSAKVRRAAWQATLALGGDRRVAGWSKSLDET